MPPPLPSLSVVMVNHNHGRYIEEALRAILDQEHRPDEAIVVDDASTDDSVAVVRRLARRRPVRLVRQERNQGVVAAMNLGLELATGDYVYLAASDDRVLPGLFGRSLTLLAQHPEVGLCCSLPVTMDGEGTIRVPDPFAGVAAGCWGPADLPGLMRVGGLRIACHASLIRRAALLKVGGFIPELRWHSDWFALLAVGFRFGICHLPEPLAAIRVLPSSFSAVGIRSVMEQRQVLAELIRLLASDRFRDLRPQVRAAGLVRSSFPDHLGLFLRSAAGRACIPVGEVLAERARERARRWLPEVVKRALGRGSTRHVEMGAE